MPDDGALVAIVFQPVAYPIFGGVDSKIDGFVLPAPKLQVAENVHSDKTGSLQRRAGRAFLTSTDTAAVAISEWQALTRYKNNLVGFAGPASGQADKIYERSSLGWVDRGAAFSARVTETGLLSNGDGIWFMDNAVTSTGLTVYAHNVVSGASTPINVSVVDATGVTIISNYEICASGWAPRVVRHLTLVYVVYYDIADARIECKVIDTSTAALLASTLAATSGVVATDMAIVLTGAIFDVIDNTAQGPFIAYAQNVANRVVIGFLTTTGTLTNNATQVTVGDAVAITCAVATNATMHGLSYLIAGANNVKALLRSYSGGGVWVATASSGVLGGGAVGAQAAVCAFDSVTTLRIFWSGDAATTTSTGFNGKTTQATFNTASTAVTGISTIRHSQVASKVFTGPGGGHYVVIITSTTTADLQRAYYVLRGSDNVVTAVLTKDFASSVPLFGHQPSVPSVSASQYTFPGGYSIDVDNGGGIGFKRFTVEWIHSASHATIEVGEALYIAGSFPMQYDGVSATESGFLRVVDTAEVTATPSNSTGSIASNLSYSYHVIPRWTNARGETDYGADTGAITVAMGVADDTVTLSIPTIAHTFKQGARLDLVFSIWRTEDTPTADAPFYLVGTVANDPAADEVTYVDGAADGTITDEQTLDQESLENIAPQPSYLITQGGGRQFLAGLAGRPHTVRASKLRQPHEPVLWSDVLDIECPDAGGPIVAIEVMGETLVIFKESRIYRVRTDVGPNNTGTLGSFLTPELVSADTGCEGPRSVVVCPMGLMFDGVKGIMLLESGLNGVKYIGAPLEGLTDIGTINGATILPERQQIRFSGSIKTHVYDYFHSQWYVWTHKSTGPTVEWNGVLAGLDGDVVYDDPTAWTDAGDTYAMTVTLGWQKLPATMQGDLAIRRVGLTGESLAAHYLTIYISHNYETAVTQEIAETVGSAGRLIGQWRLSRQKTSAVEVTIRDAVLNVYGADVVLDTAGLKVHELVFEIGTRSGRTRT